MGHATAVDLANSNETLSDQIHLHLRMNHYPPVPLAMIAPCVQAIEAYWDENPEQLIDLPDGALWRGQNQAPAHAIIEGHHLEAWLQEDEDY